MHVNTDRKTGERTIHLTATERNDIERPLVLLRDLELYDPSVKAAREAMQAVVARVEQDGKRLRYVPATAKGA